MITYEQYVNFRDSKNMKDSDVAKAANIPASTFSDWKKGKSRPKEAKLMKISEALGITYAYMMGWEITTDKSTQALEHIINVNNENNGSSKFAEQLYNDTVIKPAAIVLTDDEIALIKKYRNADDVTKDMIVRLLSFAASEENKKK